VSGSPAIFEDVTGAILVGGLSSRLGRDKVLLQCEGVPVLHRLRNLLEPLVSEIILVGYYRLEFDTLGLRFVEDIIPGAGPLGGIFTALMSSSTPFVFVLASDMPFVPAELIENIAGAREHADAVIPRGPRGPEPLCAIYSHSCTGPLRASLEKGNRRIMTALEGLTIHMPEIPVKTREPDPFFNINFPEDLEKIK
jgi:molybdopterin-guanine dinucleotide biosynthesis protein A